MASYKVLQKSINDLNDWRKGTQETIGKLQTAGAVSKNELHSQKEYIEKQLDLLRAADKALVESLDAAKKEFSNGILKIVLWVVSILFILTGLGLTIYQVLNHS